jgi:muramoyltetrapeptide carboxypeptidase LdcA involved in peptidoglycan recycling
MSERQRLEIFIGFGDVTVSTAAFSSSLEAMTVMIVSASGWPGG